MTEELTGLDTQHFTFVYEWMHAVAPGISLVLHDFYILLYTADIHTSGFRPAVFLHKKPQFPKICVCVMARQKELKHRCCKSVVGLIEPRFYWGSQWSAASLVSHKLSATTVAGLHPIFFLHTLLVISMAIAGSYKRRSCKSWLP